MRQKCDVCGTELLGFGFILTAICDGGDDGWIHQATSVVCGGICGLTALSDVSAHFTPVGVVAEPAAAESSSAEAGPPA